MKENIEVLEFIYKDSDMGISTITNLLKTIKEKENKTKNISEDMLKEYEKFLKKSKKLLNKYKGTLVEESLMAKMGSFMGIKMEITKDNSDSRVAQMLIQGLTMGSINATKKIDDYKNIIDREILSFLKEFQKFQDDSINKLKKYL